jgi:hypothetical protein
MLTRLCPALTFMAACTPPAPEDPGDAGQAHVLQWAVDVSQGSGLVVFDAVSGEAAQVAVTGAPLDVLLVAESWTVGETALLLADAGRPLTLAEELWSYGSGALGPCRTRPAFGAAVFFCPNGSGMPFPLGTHRVAVRADRVGLVDGGMAREPWSGTVDVRVRFTPSRPDTDLPLMLRVHVPDSALPEGVAPDASTGLARTLERVQSLLLVAGLNVRAEVRASPRADLILDANTLRSEAMLDFTNQIPDEGGLDAFMLETLQVQTQDGQFHDVVSLVSAVPLEGGAPTVASLMLVRGHWRDDNSEDDSYVATLLAHETGHALGLYHPVEPAAPDGTFVVDPLADTPDELGSATDYLMHHTPLELSTRISAEQRRVMRLSPNLR